MPTSTQLKDLAKRGAELRLRELLEEVRSIHEMFPDLKDGTGIASRKRSEAPAQEAATATASSPKARKRSWSAAQRREAAERMRKYWAARKKKA